MIQLFVVKFCMLIILLGITTISYGNNQESSLSKSATDILGGIDSMKVKSCMTLFDLVSPNDIFERVLEKYYAGKRCELTLKRFEE